METLIIDGIARENRQLEFKKAKGGLPNSFFETYSSFCNSKGGTIYLGLEELKGQTIISAMLSKDDVAKLKADLFSLMNDPKKVSVNLIAEEDVQELEYEGYPVLAIKLHPAPREWRPVYIIRNIIKALFKSTFIEKSDCNLLIIYISPKNEKSIPIWRIMMRNYIRSVAKIQGMANSVFGDFLSPLSVTYIARRVLMVLVSLRSCHQIL